MEIAVVGASARSLCRRADITAQPFAHLADAAGTAWDLLALDRGAARVPYSGGVAARNLLLPGDSPSPLALRVGAMQVVGYGFSPRDTLTLSGVTGSGRLLCLQRSLLTLGGALLEAQELPLPEALSNLSDEEALLTAGLLLICKG